MATKKYLGVTSQQPTAAQLLQRWRRKFKEGGIDDYNLSAKYLVEYVCGRETVNVGTKHLSNHDVCSINQICQQRLETRMPIQYIVGEWDFRTVSLNLKPPVFIPRPETEDLVGYILEDLKHTKQTLQFLDIGSGSGAITVSLLNENKMLQGYAIDVLLEAIQLTKENAERNNVSDRLHQVIQCSIQEASKQLKQTGFNFIVSNPPYIKTEEIPNLQPEIVKFEDHCALDGGKNGLTVIQDILSTCSKLLLPLGYIWLETGLDQDIASIITRHPQWRLSHHTILPDFTGRYRFHLIQYMGHLS